MIDGITVLETIEVMDMNTNNLIVYLLMELIAIIFVTGLVEKVWESSLKAFLASFAVSFVFSGIILITDNAFIVEPSGRYQYKCIIDNAVSLVDLTKDYKIIEQHDNVYVIEDLSE